ncbi:MAG: glycosyltransferase [Candidatus Micrarchaeaceae archaeon]
MKVFIIIPARNEERRIAKTLDDYGKFAKKFGNIKIIVVSESTDGTNKTVMEAASKYGNIKLIEAREGAGKGGAIMKGFRHALGAGGEFIGFADADDAVTSRQFLKLVKTLETNTELDGVIASRYVKGGRIIGKIGLARKIASRAYNILVRLLFRVGFKDTQCGAKVFRSSAIRAVMHLIDITGMSFDINLLYEMKLKGFNINEVGIDYVQRNEGTRVHIIRNSPQMLLAALGFRTYKSRFAKLLPRPLVMYVYNRIDKW